MKENLEVFVDQLIDGTIEPPGFLQKILFEELENYSFRLGKRCHGMTLFEILRMGPSGRQLISGYGRKTERDLKTLLVDQLPGLLQREPGLNIDIPHGLASTQPALPPYPILRNLTKIDNLITEEICHSLRRRISPDQGELELGSLAYSLGLAWPNTGITSGLRVRDFLDLLPRRVFQRQIHGGLGKTKRRSGFLCTCAVAEGIAGQVSKVSGSPLLHPLFSTLSSRQLAILKRRLTVYPPATLEELGVEFNLSRERIRQIETDLLKRIRRSSLKEVLGEHERRLNRELQSKLRGKLYILNDAVPVLASGLTAEELLSIFATGFSGFNDWMRERFLNLKAGYFIGTAPEWKEICQQCEHIRPDGPVVSMRTIPGVTSIRQDHLEAYVSLNKIAEVHGDFLVCTSDGATKGWRALYWHHAASRLGTYGCSFVEFFSVYKLDPRAARLVRDAISGCATLFACTYTTFTCLVPVVRPDAPEAEKPKFDDYESGPEQESEGGLLPRIYLNLCQNWPIDSEGGKFSKLIESSNLALASPSSIQMLLSSDYRVARLSPGIFGPRNFREYSDSGRRIDKAYKLALEDSIIRSFLFVCRSVHRADTIYPLWDDRFAAEVVRFLRNRGEDDPLWETCCAVLTPNVWMDEVSALELSARKVTAQFRLRPKWIDDRSSTVPELESLAAVASRALDWKGMSWIQANSLLGASYITEERGFNCIVILSALGILTPIKDWWQIVPVSADAVAIFDKIREELSTGARTSWSATSVGQIMLKKEAREIGVRDSTFAGILRECGFQTSK